jgi:hypothetical protein
MWISLFFIVLFVFCMSYIIRQHKRLKMAIHLSRNAHFPITEDEYDGIRTAPGWKGMEPLTEESKGYRQVRLLTFLAIILMSSIVTIIIFTDWFDAAFLNIVYMFIPIMSLIKHHGSFFLLQKGIVFQGFFYPWGSIEYYEIEKIIKWHDLYGYHDKVNNGYKLSIKVKGKFTKPSYIVISNREVLDKVLKDFSKHGLLELEENKGKTTKKVTEQ